MICKKLQYSSEIVVLPCFLRFLRDALCLSKGYRSDLAEKDTPQRRVTQKAAEGDVCLLPSVVPLDLQPSVLCPLVAIIGVTPGNVT